MSRTVEHVRVKEILASLRKLYPHPECALVWHTPWELLAGVILSAQCTDARVNEVTKRLFKQYPSCEACAKAREEDIATIIFSVGAFRKKARYLKETAQRIMAVYEGEVPCSLDHLRTLSGVGRKTALVFLGNVCGVSEGIPVDTHVFRFARRYCLSRACTPEKVEKDLCALVPKREWHVFANRAIAHGRSFSPARGYVREKDPLGRYAKDGVV
jgi:endonuclease-3